MKKNCNVDIEYNGAAFLLVINNDTLDRLVVAKYKTLTKTRARIVWMYRIDHQEFTVGKKGIPVIEWIAEMKRMGYIEE